uniref:(northern house mosquito) hypothetical protein n=1 Tax=Culex pipiens TaxID=7175 RepID=A0A8D8K788_CULPI
MDIRISRLSPKLLRTVVFAMWRHRPSTVMRRKRSMLGRTITAATEERTTRRARKRNLSTRIRTKVLPRTKAVRIQARVLPDQALEVGQNRKQRLLTLYQKHLTTR